MRRRIARACRAAIVSLVVARCVASPDLRAHQPPKPSPWALKAVADRSDAIYEVGEQATFHVRLTRDGADVQGAPVRYRLTLDGHPPPIDEGTVASGTDATVRGTLSRPGFLRLDVDVTAADGTTVSGTAAVGFDPLHIPPSAEPPEDFDAFWSAQKRELASLPLDARLTPVASPNPEIECFDVQAACVGGMPVSGYYARPRGAQPRSLPAELIVHGAGVRSSDLARAASHAAKGRIALDMNAHGIPNGKPDAFYADLASTTLKEYYLAGRDSRDTVYFRAMFLRAIRGLDFLCAQPEWDGRIVFVWGGSQGGGQALAVAGLDSRVTAIFAGVPALCDHSGNVAGRIAGWPLIVAVQDGRPVESHLRAARYIDGMHFATRTRADAILTVGFIDTLCPPTAVYATYNNLAGRKQIVTGVLNGHEGPPHAFQAVDAFFDAHVARMRAQPAQPSD